MFSYYYLALHHIFFLNMSLKDYLTQNCFFDFLYKRKIDVDVIVSKITNVSDVFSLKELLMQLDVIFKSF